MSNRYRRKQGKRTPRKRILILTEGEVTEVEYLGYFIKQWHISPKTVRIQKSKHTTAAKIVDEIISLKRQNETNVHNQQTAQFDEYWAVFDTEGDFNNLKAVFNKANTHGINLAVSDPSFELWLILHFVYTTKNYNSVQELIQELGGSCLSGYSRKNKSVQKHMEDLFKKSFQAYVHAIRLREEGRKSGSEQPFTNVDMLIIKIASCAKKEYLSQDFLSIIQNFSKEATKGSGYESSHDIAGF